MKRRKAPSESCQLRVTLTLLRQAVAARRCGKDEPVNSFANDCLKLFAQKNPQDKTKILTKKSQDKINSFDMQQPSRQQHQRHHYYMLHSIATAQIAIYVPSAAAA